MIDKAQEHIKAYNESHGYGTEQGDLYETLRESKEVHREENGTCRWWTEYFVVVELDGMLIGYTTAYTTGDSSPSDLGWKFDENSIVEVQAVQKTITVYEAKK